MWKYRIVSKKRLQKYLEALTEAELYISSLQKLKHTRIRVSVPTQLGIRPVWDVDLTFAILCTIMEGGQGKRIGDVIIEVISEYDALPEQEGDREYDESY